MGKDKSRSNKIPTIIFVTLSSILFILIILNIYIYINAKEKNDLKNDLSSKLESNKFELNNIKNDYEVVKKDLDEISNIDESIENKKKELFKNAKELEDKILSGNSTAKIAYITFDDGPYYLTYKVLATLKENNVRATFFTMGRGKEVCYDNSNANCLLLYKAIVDGGHTIANHTYSHLIWTDIYRSPDNFINSLVKQENLIKEKTGAITNIVRFPGGSSTARGYKNAIIAKLKERGYGWVDWSAADGDGGDLSSTTVAMSNIKSSIDNKIEVVLLHDYSTITYSILPNIITYLREKGYILLPLYYESNMINK